MGSLVENSKKNLSLLEKRGLVNTQEYLNLKLLLEFETKFGFIS